MKKIVLNIVFCIASIFSLFAQQSLFVYRNNGVITPLFSAEIDSIRFSKIDTDSVLCDKYVTHEIYTTDSIYRIPIAQIDSVSFVKPANKLRTNTIDINTSIRNFIIKQVGLDLYLNSNISSSLLPKIGDKLVTTEMSETFPAGFAGEVSEIISSDDNIIISCQPVALDEVFEYYYSFNNTYLQKSICRSLSDGDITDGEAREVTIAPGYLGHTFDLFGLNTSYEPVEDMAISVSDIGIHFGIDPIIKARAYILVNPHYGTNVGLTVFGEYELTEKLGLACNIEISKDIPIPFTHPRIPVVPFVNFYTEIGGFVRGSASISTNNTWNQKYKSVFHWDYSSRNESVLQSVNQIIPIETRYNGQTSINGNIKIGGYIEAGFEIADKNIASAKLRGELGAFLSGDAVLYKTDLSHGRSNTSVYERLRDSGLDFGWYTSVEASANIFKWGVSHTVDIGGLLNRENIVASYRLAPYIYDSKITRNLSVKTDMDVSCKVMKGLCPWSNIGFSLRDASLQEINSHYLWEDYSYYGQEPKDLSHTFNRPLFSENYTIYPLVNILGYELLASPSANLNNQIEISTLEATNVGVHFATLRGKIENPEIISNKEDCIVCFYYNTTGNPCQGNGTYVAANILSNISNGYYSEGVRGLEANTTYYYVAAIYVGTKLYYGNVHTFKTKKNTDPDPDPDPDPNPDPNPAISVSTGGSYNISYRNATIECFYNNIPSGAECGYFLDEESSSTEISSSMNSLGCVEGNQVIPLSGLKPGTKYYYQAYVRYEGKSYLGAEMSFSTKELPIPSAITGSASDVTYNSAVVECSFYNVIEGGNCGIELTWKNGSASYSLGCINGNKSYSFSGLQPSTEYTYCAYVEFEGKTYYGEDKTFTTKSEPIPDLSGTWTFHQTYLGAKTVYMDLVKTAEGDGWAKYHASGFYGVITFDMTVSSNHSASLSLNALNGAHGAFSGTFNDDYTSISGDSYLDCPDYNNWAVSPWTVNDSWSMSR